MPRKEDYICWSNGLYLGMEGEWCGEGHHSQTYWKCSHYGKGMSTKLSCQIRILSIYIRMNRLGGPIVHICVHQLYNSFIVSLQHLTCCD